MKLTDITSIQPPEALELIKAGRDCNLTIYLLNDEYKVIHTHYNNQNNVSVSHLNFGEVPNRIIKTLVEKYLKTNESNVDIFKLEGSSIVHIHDKNKGGISYAH